MFDIRRTAQRLVTFASHQESGASNFLRDDADELRLAGPFRPVSDGGGGVLVLENSRPPQFLPTSDRHPSRLPEEVRAGNVVECQWTETALEDRFLQCQWREVRKVSRQFQRIPILPKLSERPGINIRHTDHNNAATPKQLVGRHQRFAWLVNVFEGIPHRDGIKGFRRQIGMGQRTDVDGNSSPFRHTGGTCGRHIHAANVPTVSLHRLQKCTCTAAEIE